MYRIISQNLGLPHVKAEQYNYTDALAMALADLQCEISEGLKAVGEDPSTFAGTFTVYIKDGGDGMGDVKRKQHASHQNLADKALRYSFCIMKITVVKNGVETTVYRESAPNSQFHSRPLLIALADENDYHSFTCLTGPLFAEREHLQKSTLELVNNYGSTWKFSSRMLSTMYDEKLERKVVGLAGSSSEFLCTMCETTRTEAYENPFSSTITRTFAQNTANIDRKITNDSTMCHTRNCAKKRRESNQTVFVR